MWKTWFISSSCTVFHIVYILSDTWCLGLELILSKTNSAEHFSLQFCLAISTYKYRAVTIFNIFALVYMMCFPLFLEMVFRLVLNQNLYLRASWVIYHIVSPTICAVYLSFLKILGGDNNEIQALSSTLEQEYKYINLEVTWIDIKCYIYQKFCQNLASLRFSKQ